MPSLPRVPLVLVLAASAALAGCAAGPEVIVETAAGRRVTAEQIDADPWALLPSGAVTWAELDARALFGAEFGDEAARVLLGRLPLAPEAAVDPTRDVDRLHVGVYATVGADVAVVARGRFDRKRIADAIAGGPRTARDREIRVHRFAGFDVYVADGAALVPVTDKTLVAGTELGVRRVLERLEEGRLVRALPRWYEEMLRSGASFSLGVDLDAQPVPATVRTRLSWLEGLRAGRLLGNFEPPGVNLAGTLTYDRPETAEAAARGVEEQARSLDRYGALLAMLGAARPIRRLEARPTGKSTQVVVELDGRSLAALLARAEQLVGRLGE